MSEVFPQRVSQVCHKYTEKGLWARAKTPRIAGSAGQPAAVFRETQGERSVGLKASTNRIGLKRVQPSGVRPADKKLQPITADPAKVYKPAVWLRPTGRKILNRGDLNACFQKQHKTTLNKTPTKIYYTLFTVNFKQSYLFCFIFKGQTYITVKRGMVHLASSLLSDC